PRSGGRGASKRRQAALAFPRGIRRRALRSFAGNANGAGDLACPVPLRSAWSLVLVFILLLVLLLLLCFVLVLLLVLVLFLLFRLVLVLVFILVLIFVLVLVLWRLLDALEDHDGQAGAALEVLGAVLGVGLGVAVLDGVAVDLVDALDGLLVGQAVEVG